MRLAWLFGWGSGMLGCLLASAVALAADHAPRVLLVPNENEELARKVEAEAGAVGLPLLRVTARPEGEAIPELVAARGADGAVVLEAPERVRIYVPGVAGARVYDVLVERASADGDAFATRVVEQVRGRLVELDLLPSTSPSPPVASAAPSVAATSEHSPPPSAAPRVGGGGPRLALSVGGGVSVAPGGLGAIPALGVGLRAEPSEAWAITARALFPVTDSAVRAEEGSADVSVQLFLGEVAYRLLRPSSSFRPEVGAGGGLAVLPMEADATPPYEGKSARLLSGVVYVHGGAGLLLWPWLHLRLLIRGGVNAPVPVVRFDGREVASWGRGLFVATLDGELGWVLSQGGAP